jgi:PhoH-like ATPase
MAGKKRTVTVVKSDIPEDLSEHPFYGIELDEEQKIFANAIWNPNIDIVFCNAKAGSGKSLVATGVANLLVQYGMFDSIVYIMSPYGERKQGWLPGTITEKSSVYFEAFYQALISCNVNPHTAINDDSMVNQKNGTGYITCITDTFLRGSNLDNAVVILDEAQNYTVPQLKKTLTRIGKRAKVIVIGHDLQCDLEKPEQSGFVKYIEHFKEKERAAVCTLTTNHRSWISQWADEVRE